MSSFCRFGLPRRTEFCPNHHGRNTWRRAALLGLTATAVVAPSNPPSPSLPPQPPDLQSPAASAAPNGAASTWRMRTLPLPTKSTPTVPLSGDASSRPLFWPSSHSKPAPAAHPNPSDDTATSAAGVTAQGDSRPSDASAACGREPMAGTSAPAAIGSWPGAAAASAGPSSPGAWTLTPSPPFRPPIAVALALGGIALVLLPLLHMIRHAELAAHGLTAVLAAATAAAATTLNNLQPAPPSVLAPSQRVPGPKEQVQQLPNHATSTRGSKPSGGSTSPSTAFVLPLPKELALQPVFIVLLLLPLVLSVTAAVAASVSSSGAATAPLCNATASAWCRAWLLYAMALLLPSPGPGSARRVAAAGGTATRRRLHVLTGTAAVQGLRVLLLATSWAAARGSSGGHPAWSAAALLAWVAAAGPFWALHCAGVLAVAGQLR